MRAAEAGAQFCYQAKKWIGSLATALGGLDTLVFAGGMGENGASLRMPIYEGLGFLGIKLNESSHAEHSQGISTDGSRAPICVIRTDKESMMARSILRHCPHEVFKKPASR